MRASARSCVVRQRARAAPRPRARRRDADAPLAAPLRVVRRDERERARRRRAVVVGEPQREIDERRRQRLGDALDRRRLDAVRRRDVDLGDDAAPPRVAEPHLDDRALLRLVRHLVRERPRDRARGHERIDGGVPLTEPTVPGAMVGADEPAATGIPTPTSPRCSPRSRATWSSRTPSPPRPTASRRETVLELGTGTGETALRVLARHPGARWTGIDASEPMLARARERLPRRRPPRSRASRIRCPRGPFDLVVSVLAVHHLDARR